MSSGERIRLIWDFHGPAAERTAAHHAQHLAEFASGTLETPIVSGSKPLGPEYHIAYLVVPRDQLITYRDRLKPHRAELYEGA